MTDYQPAPQGPTPLSPDEIAVMIRTEGNAIGSLIEEIQMMADAASTAEAFYKVNFAKFRLEAWHKAEQDGKKMTVDRAEDAATVATANDRLEFLTTMQSLAAAREAMRARIARLNALQTLAGLAQRAGG